MKSNQKWPLKTHVEMHSNARCELVCLELSALIRSPKMHVNANSEQGFKSCCTSLRQCINVI